MLTPQFFAIRKNGGCLRLQLKSNILRLYYSTTLTGTWSEHLKSPLIDQNEHISRPGGRSVLFNEHIFRFTQDDNPTYGNQIRAFEITELTKTDYREREVKGNPILKPQRFGWNAHGIHHVDACKIGENEWIACVDGNRKTLKIEFKV